MNSGSPPDLRQIFLLGFAPKRLTPPGAGTTATPLSGGGVAFSASALSFLAGFRVEGVFKMVQNILVTVFGDQPHTSSAKPSA